MSKFENGLFIFRRDLRIVDNNGLNIANFSCKKIYPIFIFTPEQVGSKNEYKSDNSVQFMIESLQDLASQISKQGGKLLTFYGKNDKVISECIKNLKIDYICFNKDITPYARERDESIMKLCLKMGVLCDVCDDYYLHPVNSIFNLSGQPYQKFTPYYLNAKSHIVPEPSGPRKIHFSSNTSYVPNQISLKVAFLKFTKENKNVLVHGGRTNAIKTLANALKTQKSYEKTRNDMEKNTSLLSASIKFGNLSIREIHHKFKNNAPFIRQLYWRDFYAQILYNFPYVLNKSMKPDYNKIRWHNNTRWFQSWCDGTTGFPIVDACMRQLNTTGYMHNRGRLIVSSFLVKTMLIDYKKGEKYFAESLIDYDVASNGGNWLWIMGGGADSQQWFRIFNPWLQSKENDPECNYIKKWVPELKDVPSKAIHEWFKYYVDYKNIDYNKPILIYEEQKEKAIKMYKDALY